MLQAAPGKARACFMLSTPHEYVRGCLASLSVEACHMCAHITHLWAAAGAMFARVALSWRVYCYLWQWCLSP